MSRFRSMAVLACAVIAMAEAQAAPGIWRCGNSYSDQPCADARPIQQADDAPGPERQRQADEATRRDMQAAERMQRERLRLEARQAQQRPLLIGQAPQEAPATVKATKKKKEKALKASDAFVASYPNPDGKEKKKKKATAVAEGN